jgi:hypothetical protein
VGFYVGRLKFQSKDIAMIYSDSFVWLHFPKCAGTKIERLFKKNYSNHSEIVQDLIGFNLFGLKWNSSGSWHDSVLQRESRDPKFQLGSRVVICSIRRLPSWLESRYSFEYRRSPKLNHRPDRLLQGKLLERNGFESHADMYAMQYLPQAILESGKVRFIRMEHFESDFKSVFGDFLDVSLIPDSAFMNKTNVSKSCLSLEFRKNFYDNQESLYEKCPYWKRVEEMAYGPLAAQANPKNLNQA